MPTRMLTARFVDGIKPTTGQRVEYFDQTVPGLAIRVTPTGAKSWTVLYRHRARLRRLTLGSAAVVTLADARGRARDLLYAAGKGEDPAAVKQAGRTAQTIGDLAELYITNRGAQDLVQPRILSRLRATTILNSLGSAIHNQRLAFLIWRTTSRPSTILRCSSRTGTPKRLQASVANLL